MRTAAWTAVATSIKRVCDGGRTSDAAEDARRMAEDAALTIIEPESDRYRAELIFLAGLWVGSSIWRTIAAGFAHRGWRCVLLDRPDPAGAEHWPAAVAEAVRARAAKPILVGHDAGALLALDLAARGLVRGAIAVAPLLDGLRPVVSPFARTLLPLRRATSPVAPPAPGSTYFAGVPAAQHELLRTCLHPEPVGYLRAVARLAAPAAPRAPTLLVAQQADEVASQLFVEICASGIKADFLRLQGGHWPMLEARADDWITQVHRWIIKRLGHGLLILRGDEDLAEP